MNNNNNNQYSQFEEEPRGIQNKMVNFIMKISGGAIKEEKHANYVLLGIVAVIFIISFLVLKSSFGSPAETESLAPPADSEEALY